MSILKRNITRGEEGFDEKKLIYLDGKYEIKNDFSYIYYTEDESVVGTITDIGNVYNINFMGGVIDYSGDELKHINRFSLGLKVIYQSMGEEPLNTLPPTPENLGVIFAYILRNSYSEYYRENILDTGSYNVKIDASNVVSAEKEIDNTIDGGKYYYGTSYPCPTNNPGTGSPHSLLLTNKNDQLYAYVNGKIYILFNYIRDALIKTTASYFDIRTGDIIYFVNDAGVPKLKKHYIHDDDLTEIVLNLDNWVADSEPIEFHVNSITGNYLLYYRNPDGETYYAVFMPEDMYKLWEIHVDIPADYKDYDYIRIQSIYNYNLIYAHLVKGSDIITTPFLYNFNPNAIDGVILYYGYATEKMAFPFGFPCFINENYLYYFTKNSDTGQVHGRGIHFSGYKRYIISQAFERTTDTAYTKTYLRTIVDFGASQTHRGLALDKDTGYLVHGFYDINRFDYYDIVSGTLVETVYLELPNTTLANWTRGFEHGYYYYIYGDDGTHKGIFKVKHLKHPLLEVSSINVQYIDDEAYGVFITYPTSIVAEDGSEYELYKTNDKTSLVTFIFLLKNDPYIDLQESSNTIYNFKTLVPSYLIGKPYSQYTYGTSVSNKYYYQKSGNILYRKRFEDDTIVKQYIFDYDFDYITYRNGWYYRVDNTVYAPNGKSLDIIPKYIHQTLAASQNSFSNPEDEDYIIYSFSDPDSSNYITVQCINILFGVITIEYFTPYFEVIG